MQQIDGDSVGAYKPRWRGEHSTNCKALLLIRDDMLCGHWRITRMVLKHNHVLRPRSVRFFRCHRKLPDFVKRQIEINDRAGIPQKHLFRSVIAQSDGFDNSTYIERDLYNHIMRSRSIQMAEGDAAGMLKYLQQCQEASPDFFYNTEVDPNGHLKAVFWADAHCRATYKHFGDVISFDNTYLTNKYGMPFSPFVGVNQHGQTILLGCALLPDETTETYCWLLKTWLSCMHNSAPKGIITNQCGAMANAIEQVLPSTRHRLCLWHIMKKLPTKIGQGARREHILHRSQ
ncbi:hypothetical protein LUZ60_013332 [Juncus effusus]|nr:hypothetical protein LUZ60_013332 [Juncus effusus]